MDSWSVRQEVVQLLLAAKRAPGQPFPGGADDGELAELQSRLGMPIPVTLVDWLRVCKGDAIDPGGVYGARPEQPSIDMASALSRLPGWRPRGWMPIACDGCGDYYVLIGNGELAGYKGCNGIGRHVAQRLVADGETVVDVPAKLAARARVFDTGNGRKTDPADAHSVAVVALRTKNLTQVRIDDDLVALRLLVDRRDELARTRTQTINRLHRLLLELVPGGAKRFLTAAQAKALLDSVAAYRTPGTRISTHSGACPSPTSCPGPAQLSTSPHMRTAVPC
jgi:hypothetical protein